MAKQLQHLQAIAWEIKSLPDMLRTISILKMPPVMQHILRGIPNEKGNIAPIGSLHDMLAASSHSIIAFAPEIYKSADTYPDWLYATADTTLQTRKLVILFNKWLEAIGCQDRISQNSELHWDWDTIDVLASDFNLQRMILPNLIARWLVTQEFMMSFGNQKYDLRLVPLMSRRYIAELITEPIIKDDAAKSYIMQFWLEPLENRENPVLLHKTRVRRWCTDKVYIKFRRSKSMYLRRQAGYLETAKRHDIFTRVTVRNFGGRNNDYVGKQADVYRLLPIGGSVPDLASFMDNPSQYQSEALIPIENRNARDEPIGQGIESGDHRDIFNSLDALFSPNFASLPRLQRIEQGNNRAWHDKASKVHHEQSQTSSIKSTQYHLSIEIHCELLETFHRLTGEIIEQMGASATISEAQTQITIHDARRITKLTIKRVENQQLTDTLGTQEKREDRVKKIIRSFRPVTQVTGILVELSDYRSTELKKYDPKQAIREGLTQTGRINQFIVPEADSPHDYNRRTKNAVGDLLRMLGYRHQPFFVPIEKRSLPTPLDLLAFWVFQLNRSNKRYQTIYLPIAAFVPHGCHHLQLIIPSNSGRAECYASIPAGLHAVSKWALDFNEHKQVIGFFRAVVEEYAHTSPTLLMLPDGKLRRYFSELYSSEINQLSLNGVLDIAPEIRVARLRFSADNDAPFCTPPEPKSKYPGLYGDPNKPQLAYSLHNVGHIHQRKDATVTDQPHKPSYNPSTVLIQMCNLQAQDDPHEWQGLIHQLRIAHDHIDTASLLPQPLHDLDSIKKFIPDVYDETDTEEDINAIESHEE